MTYKRRFVCSKIWPLAALGCLLEGMQKQWYGWNFRAPCAAINSHGIRRAEEHAIVAGLWTLARPIAASESTRRKERDRRVPTITMVINHLLTEQRKKLLLSITLVRK